MDLLQTLDGHYLFFIQYRDSGNEKKVNTGCSAGNRREDLVLDGILAQ
jgi:hypothetical protein